ncbi:hypothetical protein MNV49_001768 [Pseudohyphozyma bogoriensis]|nr:hypothetical protein MNV49_001768 [Pseudohyphozyma bogoriensis]
MLFTSLSLALLSLSTLLTSTSAASHAVSVGSGGLSFSPTTVTASAGDTIVFTFEGAGHSVTQSTFAAPCSHSVDASGAANDASQPVWLYCRQVTHCQSGMVMAINPTASQTFDAFLAAAKGVSFTETWMGETMRLNGTGVFGEPLPHFKRSV